MKRPMTAASVLRALRVGPATADELAYDLAGGARLASAILHNLATQARVKSRPYYGDDNQRGVKLLYSLPEHAR